MSLRSHPQPIRSAAHIRRRTLVALALAGVLLIPAAQIYRTRRAVPVASRESVPVEPSRESAAEAETPSGSVDARAEAEPEAAARPGVDASNFYKNAFVLYAALTDEEKKMFRQPIEELDPDKAAALFKKIQPILELLRRAAEADYCEWALGPLNFETPLPHLSKSQELARLAQWSAGYRFPSDPQGALVDLAAQARLGDHLVGSLIGWLVQMSFEGGANKVLRQNAGLLDKAGTLQAQEFLRSSSVEQNVARAFAAESGAVEAMAQKLAAQTPAERMKLLQAYGTSEESSHGDLEQIFRNETLMTAEFQYLRQIEQQMAEAMLWPDAQYHAWWKGVEGALPKHPLAALSLPGFSEMRKRLQQTQVERTMLSAGLTLLQSGPEQLAQFRDPVSGTAFSYVEKPDGFELQSTFKKAGKPVTMSFMR